MGNELWEMNVIYVIIAKADTLAPRPEMLDSKRSQILCTWQKFPWFRNHM